MPIRLPLDQLLVPVRQISASVSVASLARHATAIVLLPAEPTAADWRALPHGALLRELFIRKARRAGDLLQMRVGARAQTNLLMVCIATQASTFERLSAAAKIARAVLEADPDSLLLVQQGCAAEAADAAFHAVIAAVQAAAFRFHSFKSQPRPKPALAGIALARTGALPRLKVTLASAAGNNLARWLTVLPPNTLDARGYRRLIEQLAAKLDLTYRFYGEPQLKRLGAGAFLAVAQGNPTRDAGIAYLGYRPRGATAAPLALVGKGICFDTGGTNLKPHKSMLDMHTDMEGSAVALGTLYALHMLESKERVDCWLAITENKIGSRAYKPQDVVVAMNGTSIQVIHTDAEGRMVLADALCLAASKKPRAIIDYATLTGACVSALTERYSGAFSNRPEAREALEAAGTSSGERVWCFPMDADYDSDLDSSVADIVQCAVDGKGDHILAARFLNRFVPGSIPWVHVDLSAGARGGGLGHIATEITGFGVRYSLQLIEDGWPAKRAPRRGV
jgi:leucyl aminopeptidase